MNAAFLAEYTAALKLKMETGDWSEINKLVNKLKGGVKAGEMLVFAGSGPKENRNVSVNILKERPMLPGSSEFVFSPDGLGDFTKLEDRIIAHVGKGIGIDCHRQKAAEMFGIAYEDVTPEQRAAGKNANYVDWWK